MLPKTEHKRMICLIKILAACVLYNVWSIIHVLSHTVQRQYSALS